MSAFRSWRPIAASRWSGALKPAPQRFVPLTGIRSAEIMRAFQTDGAEHDRLHPTCQRQTQRPRPDGVGAPSLPEARIDWSGSRAPRPVLGGLIEKSYPLVTAVLFAFPICFTTKDTKDTKSTKRLDNEALDPIL